MTQTTDKVQLTVEELWKLHDQLCEEEDHAERAWQTADAELHEAELSESDARKAYQIAGQRLNVARKREMAAWDEFFEITGRRSRAFRDALEKTDPLQLDRYYPPSG